VTLKTDALDLIDRAAYVHDRIALQFSGGKDSLTLLHLLKPWWPRLIVLWANPGDPFPELVEQMIHVKREVWQFHEVRGNVLESKAWPVDILPVRSSECGHAVEPEGSKVLLRSRFDCCFENFWLPMTAKVKELGITCLFRGQRTQEHLRGPCTTGDKDPSGATIYLPIDGWSVQDVLQYLDGEGVKLPEHYKAMPCSLECMHCTAYTEGTRGKLFYLRQKHPEVAKELSRRLTLINHEVATALEDAKKSLDEVTNLAFPNPLESLCTT
jgi:3'-phosphoadenosine 5'-phosphosulfate sulfotransferase (PAPS reductase)/FAD synthetase